MAGVSLYHKYMYTVQKVLAVVLLHTYTAEEFSTQKDLLLFLLSLNTITTTNCLRDVTINTHELTCVTFLLWSLCQPWRWRPNRSFHRSTASQKQFSPHQSSLPSVFCTCSRNWCPWRPCPPCRQEESYSFWPLLDAAASRDGSRYCRRRTPEKCTVTQQTKRFVTRGGRKQASTFATALQEGGDGV